MTNKDRFSSFAWKKKKQSKIREGNEFFSIVDSIQDNNEILLKNVCKMQIELLCFLSSSVKGHLYKVLRKT